MEKPWRSGEGTGTALEEIGRTGWPALGRPDGASLSRPSVSWNHRFGRVHCVRYSLAVTGVAWIPSGQETLGESGTMS